MDRHGTTRELVNAVTRSRVALARIEQLKRWQRTGGPFDPDAFIGAVQEFRSAQQAEMDARRALLVSQESDAASASTAATLTESEKRHLAFVRYLIETGRMGEG